MTNEDVKIKVFQDGDQMCVVRKDFVDLQESPALFFPVVNSQIGGRQHSAGDKIIGGLLNELRGNLPRAFAELEQQIPALLHRYMLCLTPHELTAEVLDYLVIGWTAFPQHMYWEYAERNFSRSMFEAVLLGALAAVETVR